MKISIRLLIGIMVLGGLFLLSGSVSAGNGNIRDNKHAGFSVKPQDNRVGTGKMQVDPDFGKFPLYFIFNKGQVHKKAKFYAKASRYTLWLTKEGLVFDSTRKVADSAHSYKFHRNISRLIFLKANKNPGMVPVEESTYKVNFLKGNDPAGWYGHVPASMAVLYKDIYRDIDLKVYGIEKQIEYDWIVKPGGDPGEIRFQYGNVKSSRLDESGNLLVETEFGELLHRRPVSYQMIDEKKVEVISGFVKLGENTYGFKVGEYDSGYDLVIDPVVLAYSTYLGGQNADEARDIVLDGSGYLYVVGSTYSWDFPVLNQYQSDQEKYDAFVSKLDTSGSGVSSLLYSTYLGGEEDDNGLGIALDSSGIVYVVGTTRSSSFPTLNPYMTKPVYASWDYNRDAFVTKLDISKSGAEALLYSTYLGGQHNDYGWKIKADDTGKVIVAGMTESDNFPILNYFQTRQYNRDGFVAKLDTTQSGEDCLLYSTYLGGTGTEYLNGLAVDGSGYVYVVGYTESVDFPTKNQYQDNQRVADGFLTKFDLTESGDDSLLYSTYLGGYETDSCAAVAVDNNGIATIGGNTYSSDFPLLNQYQTYNANGDAFIMKVDTTESGDACLIYSTYLGGSNSEGIYGITFDGSGNIYATGVTNSTDFPTLYPYQTDQTLGDVMVLKLDPSQSGTAALLFSTYLGGDGSEYALSITLDSSEDVYVAGYTQSTDFPTLNQYQGYSSDWDAFITRLYFQTLPTVTTDDVSSITFTSASGGGNVTSDGKAAVTARGVCWSTSENPTLDDSYTTDGDGTGSFTGSLTDLTPNTLYYVRAYATNSVGTAYGEEVSFETLNPSITVTSPNGGESWVVGTAHNITWTSDGVDGNIKIEYSADNGDNWTVVIASTENDGTYSWTVPDAVSTQCLIRVEETDGSPADTGDSVFTILPPSITVTSPNGGENWETGSQQSLTWTSIGTVGNVKIEYSTDNGVNWTEIIASTENDGAHSWTVPDTVSSQCLIRVGETDGSPSDTSDSVFTIFAPSITVTSPNGGENWDVESVQTITWTSKGTVGNVVRIEYSINNGGSWATIVQSTENDGSYNWNVPGQPSDNCLVRVSETDDDGGPSDVSDAVFSIVSTVSGTLTLRTPNGGETWAAGSPQQIQWSSTGDIANVTIQYSIDNGTTWKRIVQSAANNGSYDWVVPERASDLCLVRISAGDSDLDPKPDDVSDAVFSIVLPTSPGIRVIAPNGGEQLVAGTRFNVTWNAVNTRGDIIIEYSVDGGENWRQITADAGNNGKYAWIVPDAPSDNCLVRISETGGQPSDVGDALFSIVSPATGDITVTSPNGGESWPAGSVREIKWTASGIDNVAVEYSKDYGTTWETVVQNTPNSGSYNWTVPDVVSDECLVRIISNDGFSDPKPADVGDGVFSIVPSSSPALRVIAPNGGEQLAIGTRFNITWNVVNSRENIKIEYSLNGGESWTVITGAVENNGGYDWLVPDTPSETCLVRVSEANSQLVDISDAVFSIVQPLSGDFVVTSPNGGESWTVGSVHEIKWTAGDINNVSIECSIDNGITWKRIVQTTENDGSYDWTVPDTVSDECLVRISSSDSDPDPIPSDISDRVFSITPGSTGEFRVTSPNGGESWEVGETHSITWTGSGDINSVMIQYSYDSGNTWNTIVSAASNSGTYDWQVPDTVSEQCLVRITANGGDVEPQPMDVSDSEFSIVLPSSPVVRVITPNGGEQLIAGLKYEITWFSNNSREPVKIEYSVNGGQTWTEIAGAAENDGEYDWTVPDEPSEICLVRVSETAGEPVDISDAVFSIVSPSTGDLTLLTPNGGENLEAGTESAVTWTGSNLNNIIIEYSTNNGDTWLYIDKVPADNGSYTWTVPGTPSETCLVRVRGADADENPWDVSDGVFTIFDPSLASIEVFTPNGGESLSAGEEYYITWAGTGVNDVLIEYTTTNGEQWIPIEIVPAIRGRFTWTVPDTPSDNCLIRITGNDSPESPSDVSDALFSIVSD